MFNGNTKAVNAVRGLLQGIVIQRAIDEMFHDRCVSCSHTLDTHSFFALNVMKWVFYICSIPDSRYSPRSVSSGQSVNIEFLLDMAPQPHMCKTPQLEVDDGLRMV